MRIVNYYMYCTSTVLRTTAFAELGQSVSVSLSICQSVRKVTVYEYKVQISSNGNRQTVRTYVHTYVCMYGLIG